VFLLGGTKKPLASKLGEGFIVLGTKSMVTFLEGSWTVSISLTSLKNYGVIFRSILPTSYSSVDLLL
jgi:hypothetical protein